MLYQTEEVLIIAFGFAAAWMGAELIRRNAEKLRLVQTPNERSSHTMPTPSGGGLGIAFAGTVCGLLIDTSLFWPILASVSAALLGLLDDRFGLSARVRLIVHFALIAMVLATVGPLPPLATPLGSVPSVALGALLLVAGVWWLNLYNFMDGIDGLAASQAIFLCAGAATLAHLGTIPAELEAVSWWAFAVAAASAGFLVLNWPPARIFMGDAGSNFLAVAIFSISMSLVAQGYLELPVFVILTALFVADATTTLIGRLRSGNSGFTAHRLHVYQKLSRRLGQHKAATLIYLAINIAWLYPLAYLAREHSGASWWFVALAYLPLVSFGFVARAGLPEGQPQFRNKA